MPNVIIAVTFIAIIIIITILVIFIINRCPMCSVPIERDAGCAQVKLKTKICLSDLHFAKNVSCFAKSPHLPDDVQTVQACFLLVLPYFPRCE